LTRSLTPPTARPLRRFVIPVERLGIDVGVSPLISPDGTRAGRHGGQPRGDHHGQYSAGRIDAGRRRCVLVSRLCSLYNRCATDSENRVDVDNLHE
jgi:hypothetical protein